MKIAYIVKGDPYDKHSWSGTNYYVRNSLEKQGCDVYCISGFTPKRNFKTYLRKIIAKISGKHYNDERCDNYTKQWSKFILSKLQPNTDAIFSLGTLMIADLNVNIPIFIYVDGIFEQMRVFYKWKSITKKNIEDGNLIEQRAIDNCKKIISCSKETGKSILNYYKLNPSKLEIVPLGANLDDIPSKNEVLNYIAQRNNDVCHLLFIGVDWYRKGADIALSVTEILHDRGLKVQLDLCGLKDVPVELPKYVVNHGFLRKTDKEEFSVLKKLYSFSHFLVVPSRAEAYGLVFCEASAYGLPSISFKEGGLTTIVENGVNGQLFNLEDSPEIFADYIYKVFNDKDKYNLLAKSSYKRYKDLLNWDVAGKNLVTIIESSI